MEWTKTYGRKYFDNICSIQQTSDGGYISAGERIVVKFSPSGDVEWARDYSVGDWHSVATSIQQTYDSGYIIGGFLVGTAPLGDFYVVKTDLRGIVPDPLGNICVGNHIILQLLAG